MEPILLAVTVVSMLVALVMSAVAWRLAREERARSAARVAALAAAANLDTPVSAAGDVSTSVPAAAPALPVHAVAATPVAAVASELSDARAPWPTSRLASIAPARTMPVRTTAELALNQPIHDERPLRAPARLAQEVRVAGMGRRTAESIEPAMAAPIADSFLSAPAMRGETGRQRGLMAAAAVLLVVLGAGAYFLTADRAATATAAAAPATDAPLELLSLRHQRQGSRLTLSGLVKNPAAGAPIENLIAVVFLFDAQGGFVSSARSGIDFKRLAPGDESPFVIAVDAPANVSRYRVSFRTEAGIVAHVDRRAEQPAATSRM